MITVKYIYSCGRTVSDVPGAVLLSAGLRDRREQNNRDADFSFPLHGAQHMPYRCRLCCSAVVPLAGCVLQPTSAPHKTQQGEWRHRHSALCSLPTPCIALGAHLKQISLGQAGIWGHHSFRCHLSSPRGCTERLVALAGQPQSSLITMQGALLLEQPSFPQLATQQRLWARARGPPLRAGSNLETCMGKACILQRPSKELHYKAVLTLCFGGSCIKAPSRAKPLNLSQKQATGDCSGLEVALKATAQDVCERCGALCSGHSSLALNGHAPAGTWPPCHTTGAILETMRWVVPAKSPVQ